MSKITNLAPFAGYAQNEEQTERKRLHNVLKKGDLYFNTGDLMRIDKDNFIYFQDRVGDTFRYWTHHDFIWKIIFVYRTNFQVHAEALALLFKYKWDFNKWMKPEEVADFPLLKA